MNTRKEAVNAKIRMRLQTQRDLTSFVSSTMFFCSSYVHLSQSLHRPIKRATVCHVDIAV